MLAFPSMLLSAAEKAGMPCPPNPDKFETEEFPHFHVFCNVQLGRAMEWDEHWENAKVLARIPVEELKLLTLEDLLEKGLRVKGI